MNDINETNKKKLQKIAADARETISKHGKFNFNQNSEISNKISIIEFKMDKEVINK